MNVEKEARAQRAVELLTSTLEYARRVELITIAISQHLGGISLPDSFNTTSPWPVSTIKKLSWISCLLLTMALALLM